MLVAAKHLVAFVRAVECDLHVLAHELEQKQILYWRGDLDSVAHVGTKEVNLCIPRNRALHAHEGAVWRKLGSGLWADSIKDRRRECELSWFHYVKHTFQKPMHTDVEKHRVKLVNR